MMAYVGRTAADLSPYLVDNRTSLAALAKRDGRGQSHRDGWGIGQHVDARPRIVRSTQPAFDDPGFARAAGQVGSTAVIAHVRQKSVGPVDKCNNHPFAHGAWMFAHNGTVTGFSQIAPRLSAETDLDLLAERRGTTDSEWVFFWLLSRLRKVGVSVETATGDPDVVARALADCTRLLDANTPSDDEGKARLTFFLSDGSHLFATRLRRSLFWLDLPAGAPMTASPVGDAHTNDAVLVASEPLSDEPWREMAEASILTIGPDLRPLIEPL
jgi:glutamine amidotransferase